MKDQEFNNDLQVLLRPGIEYDNAEAYEPIKPSYWRRYKPAFPPDIPASVTSREFMPQAAAQIRRLSVCRLDSRFLRFFFLQQLAWHFTLFFYIFT